MTFTCCRDPLSLQLQSVKYIVNVDSSSPHPKGTFPFCRRLTSMSGPTSALSNQIKLCGTWHAQPAIAKLPKKVVQAIGVKVVRSISTVAIAGRWSNLFGPVPSCMKTSFLLKKVLSAWSYHCRYIMLAKMSDSSGEAWISAFNEQAESLLGQSAEDLAIIRDQVPHLFPLICSP